MQSQLISNPLIKLMQLILRPTLKQHRLFAAIYSLAFGTLLSLIWIPSAHSEIVRPPPPAIQANSYILMDAETGQVLLEKDSAARLPPASITKIMTSYIIAYELEQGTINNEDLVNISVKAWKKQGSRMFVREGTQVPLKDLIQGIIVQSGNDASIAVAEHISGSEEAFADLMNQHAKTLGMHDTLFKNSTGWPDPEHLTTAKDLAILTRALIRKFPEHYAIYSERSFTYNNITQPNRNILLNRDPNVDGVKTGFTEGAGYCLVASSIKEGMRLISVVMGASGPNSRATESQKLLSYGHRFFKTLSVFAANDPIGEIKVWKGKENKVMLGIQKTTIVTIPRDQVKSLKTTQDLPKDLRGPIEAGQVVGKIEVALAEDVIAVTNLIALESVEQAGFFKRLWHSILLFFDGLFG